MNKRQFLLIGAFLLIFILTVSLATATYRESSSKYLYGGIQSTGGSMMGDKFDSRVCSEGQDFILQIDASGCTPTVVRSDLLEEQDVPVFCPIKATKINPLIDVNMIRSITFGGQFPREVRSVAFYPAKAAVTISDDFTNPFYDDLGYAVIMLRNQRNESAMPDFVEGNITASIRYDVDNAFGIRQNNFYLPVMSNSEWESKMERYSFWDARGYLRADDIQGNIASITLYSDVYNSPITGNPNQKTKFKSFSLREGEETDLMFLPGFYCFAGLRLKLEGIEEADTRALLKINSEYVELKEGERFLDDKCYVKEDSLKSKGINKKATIFCQEDNKRSSILFQVTPKLEILVDGELKTVSIGESIYTKEGNTIYLGYAYLLEDLNKVGNLRAHIVSKPGIAKQGETLSNEEINSVMGLTKKLDSESKGIFGLLSSISGIFSLSKSSWLSEEASRQILEVGKSVTFEGSSIKLVGFSEGYNSPFDSSDILKYYTLAEESYNLVSNDFRGLSYPENSSKTLDQEALEEYISVADYLDQKSDLKYLCAEFSEKYSKAKFPEECKNLKNVAEAGSSIETVLIDGSYRDISLLDISEPDFFDYGVKIFIQNSNGASERIPLEKDDIFYLNSLGKTESNNFQGDSIKLISILSQTKAIVQINIANVKNNTTITLEKGKSQSFGNGYIFTLEEVHLTQYAKVSVTPEVNYKRSDAEFKFKIFIEKRGIKLSPEKIQDRVEALNKTINEWTRISNTLGDVVKGLKTACVGASAVITVKNLLQDSGGESIARTQVMRGDDGWTEKCTKLVSDKKYSSIDSCFLAHANDIEAEVGTIHGKIKTQNTVIEGYQEGCINDVTGFLEKKTVDTKCLVKKYSADVRTEIKNFNSINPNDPSESLNLSGISNALNENAWGNHTYTLDQLKEIDLYYKLWNAETDAELKTKYQKKLYSTLYDVEKNTENYVLSQSLAQQVLDDGLDNSRPRMYLDKNAQQEIYDGDVVPSDFGELKKGGPVQSIIYKHELYYVTLNTSGGGDYYIAEVYGGDKKKANAIIATEIKNSYSYFKKYDQKSYQNEYLTPELKYYDTEPYAGEPALVPVDIANGWYVYIRQNIAAGGNIASYQDSGFPSSFVLCNVGENGFAEYPASSIDDICQIINTNTGQAYNQFPGLNKLDSERIIKLALEAISQAQRVGSKKVGSEVLILGQRVKISGAAVDVPLTQCADFMSVKDCQILFNVCDPVICPSSRCNFGGKYYVKDVIQSGIIGSVALCLPNIKEGVYIPVCLSGVKAGVDGWLSVTKSYKDCLEKNLETGETIGICDEMHSVYMCEFFWRQALPITKLLFPKVLEFLTGENTIRGGGEYMFVQSSLNNAENSVNYLTQNYALNAYKAFQFRSSEQVGSAVCNNFISVTYPGGVDLLDTLTEPDSPSQFTGKFDEIPFTTTTYPAISHYKVYFHIYAGNDRGAYYRVYLRGSEGLTYEDDFLGRMVDSDYIPRGEYASETVDFTAPSGMKQLCINVNGQEECGFGQVTTNFAIDYLKDQYVSRQAEETNIVTEKACISGTADWYSALNPNIQEGAGDLIDPQIYNKGIIRICSTDNPGKGSDPYFATEKQRWVDMGYCGDPSMRCWLDQESIKDAVEFAYTAETILNQTGNTLIENLMNNPNYFKKGQLEAELRGINNETDATKRLTMIDKIINKVAILNEKGHLYLLIGNAYSDLAKEAYKLFKISVEEEKTSKDPGCVSILLREKIHSTAVSEIGKNTFRTYGENGEIFYDNVCATFVSNVLIDAGVLPEYSSCKLESIAERDAVFELQDLFKSKKQTFEEVPKSDWQNLLQKGDIILWGCTLEGCKDKEFQHATIFDSYDGKGVKIIHEGGEDKPIGYKTYKNIEGEGWYVTHVWRAKCADETGIGALVSLSSDITFTKEECNNGLVCQQSIGNALFEITQQVVINKYPQVSNAEVLADTGYQSLECLTLGIAMQESSLRFCKPTSKDKDPFYCETDKEKVLSGDDGKSIGTMQVNVNAHAGKYPLEEMYSFKGNILAGVDILVGKYDAAKKNINGRTYECNGKIYSGWTLAIRYYNGWNSKTCETGINYVEEVLDKREFIEEKFPQCREGYVAPEDDNSQVIFNDGTSQIIEGEFCEAYNAVGKLTEGTCYDPNFAHCEQDNPIYPNPSGVSENCFIINPNSRCCVEGTIKVFDFCEATDSQGQTIEGTCYDVETHYCLLGDGNKGESLFSEDCYSKNQMSRCCVEGEVKAENICLAINFNKEKNPGICFDKNTQVCQEYDFKTGSHTYSSDCGDVEDERSLCCLNGTIRHNSIIEQDCDEMHLNIKDLGQTECQPADVCTVGKRFPGVCPSEQFCCKVSSSGTSANRIWTLESTMFFIKDLNGKYSDNGNNTNFIDGVCAQAEGIDEVFSEKECKDIKGESSWNIFDVEDNFETVKNLLIKKSHAKYGKWIKESALLKAMLIGQGTFTDNKDFLDVLKKDGVINTSIYNSYKKHENTNIDVISFLIEYLGGEVEKIFSGFGGGGFGGGGAGGEF